MASLVLLAGCTESDGASDSWSVRRFNDPPGHLRRIGDAGVSSDAAAPPVEEPPVEEPPVEEPPVEEPPVEEPTEPSPEEPAPEQPEPPPATGLAALAPLPAEMAGLRWPEAPRITREVTVTTGAALATEARVAGTRIHVRGAVGGNVSVSANDVEILADSASALGSLSVSRGVSRVRIVGGSWAQIHTAIPAQFGSTVEYRSEWMVSDVLIEGVRVRASDTAFGIRGRRIAIVRSRAQAERYSVWCGDTGPMQSEDIILHENVLISAGPEATVRLVQVLRSATVDNRLSNTSKHNYRVHGTSDLNYAGRNLLVGTGVMLGRMPGDDLRRVWFDDNVLHHYTPDLFNPDAGIDALVARGNVAYTDVRTCFYCSAVQPGWTVTDNLRYPYTPAPAE